MNNVVVFLSASLAIMIALIIGAMFSESLLEDGYAERKSYCELASMWEEDREQGIEPNKRDGHPNYKGISCEL